MTEGDVTDRTFEAIVFDWDGTAVPDRRADAGAVRQRVEALVAAGVHVVVVSGTHVGNIDGQLAARPTGPGSLHLCLNRGSEVFEVGPDGPTLVWTREASPAEEAALDHAADAAVSAFGARGVTAKVVSQRVNRRKIDIIPEPEWDDPPKARIDELLAAVTARLRAHGMYGLAEAVALGIEAAHQAGLADPRVTSDAKHVEIGLTDKADSMHWVLGRLAPLGIGPGLILVAGDEFGDLGNAVGSDSLMLVPEARRAIAVSVGVEPQGVPEGVYHRPGGPPAFLALLDEQLERRLLRRVPSIDDDPAWVITLDGDGNRQRVQETLLTAANGRVGIRGSQEEHGRGSEPLLAVSGVYTGVESPRLLPGPVWPSLLIRDGEAHDRWQLDLRTGVVTRERRGGRPIRTARFVSLARPAAMAMRAEGPASRLAGGEALRPPSPDLPFDKHRDGHWDVAVCHSVHGGSIAVATSTAEVLGDGRRHIERLAVHAGDPAGPPILADLRAELDDVSAAGFDRLLADHRAAWAQRWDTAAVSIDGDPEVERAVRFALFHVLASVADEGEAVVGARGLSGPGYAGHVFWDSDVFVLPTMAAIRPTGARAMLEYRLRRLPAARAAAAADGAKGAMWPWESADTGVEVTPAFARAADGLVVPIRTGEREKHITADVAWAACEYAAWSGDRRFLHEEGRDLVLEGARYWASRVRLDRAGRGHLYGMIGPDEYHEIVDDNAFTNVMARWHLRRAAALAAAAGGATAEETGHWRALAAAIVDGFDPSTGVYEQFAGYSKLAPMFIADHAPPPVAADLLLGADVVRKSQLIKQADVLMLYHLVPGEVAPKSLAANVDFYGPRTAHGSSLSPPIQASVLARARRPEEALTLFELATRIDLDDLTRTSAGGLHIATMGGVWQALAVGFLGLRPRRAGLAIDPVLPARWKGLEMKLQFRGATVCVSARHDEVSVTTDRPMTILVGPDAWAMRLDAGTTTAALPKGAS